MPLSPATSTTSFVQPMMHVHYSPPDLSFRHFLRRIRHGGVMKRGALVLLVWVALRSIHSRHRIVTSIQLPFDEIVEYNTPVAIAKRPRIMIGGTARNNFASLPLVKNSIRRLLKEFDLVGMVFFENDSQDDTLEELRRWNEVFNGTVHVISEENAVKENSRILTLAYARNKVIAKIKQLSQTMAQPFDYLLLLDMDESSGHLSGMTHCLSLPTPWHVCCANQYRLYYDLLALSTYDDWMTCYWYDCPEFVQKNTFRHIPASTDPILVESCFSGAALYHWKLLDSQVETWTLYTGRDEQGKEECEHKNFHRNLRKIITNFTAYIQPKFLTDGSGGVVEWFIENKRKQPLWEASWNDASMKKYYGHRFDP